MESIVSLLYHVSKKIASLGDGAFEYPVDRQLEYLNDLAEPTDLMDRSFKQYKCQRYLKPNYVNCITDIVSIPLIIYYLFAKSKTSAARTFSNVFISYGLDDSIIPAERVENYQSYINVSRPGNTIDGEGRKCVYKLIKRYPVSPEFILKCLIKLRAYIWVIHTYNPQSIFVSEEYSYTSSFLTYYCRKKGIKHINIMHGEKLLYIRDSFFEFDKCYIWDKYYKSLFVKMRAAQAQFEVAIPPSMKFNGIHTNKYDYIYYLANEDEIRAKKILNTLLRLKNEGCLIAVRPHPRYTEYKIKDIFLRGGIEVEDIKQVSIERSLLATKNAISLFSTVLNQAINNGVGVVIDDITDEKKYEELNDLGYIFISNNRVLKLSSILGELRK